MRGGGPPARAPAVQRIVPTHLSKCPNSPQRGRSRGSDGCRAGLQRPSSSPLSRLEGMGSRRSPGEGTGLGEKSPLHFWDTPEALPQRGHSCLRTWAFLRPYTARRLLGRQSYIPLNPLFDLRGKLRSDGGRGVWPGSLCVESLLNWVSSTFVPLARALWTLCCPLVDISFPLKGITQIQGG